MHTRTRGLLSRLLTPKRLKENEDFMWRLADAQLDEFVSRGSCEFLDDYARPFSGLVIADLLGVPPDEHEEFRVVFCRPGGGRDRGRFGDACAQSAGVPQRQVLCPYHRAPTRAARGRADRAGPGKISGRFDSRSHRCRPPRYVPVRGRTRNHHEITQLWDANARRTSRAFRSLLREDRSKIPAFVEETLRTESPVKCHFRMARTSTSIGDVNDSRRQHGDVATRGEQSRRS